MNEQQSVALFEVFPFIEGSGRVSGDLREARVVSAKINKDKSTINVTLSLPKPVAPLELSALEAVISEEYELSAAVTAVYARADPPGNGAKNAKDSQARAGTVIMGKRVKSNITPISEVTLELGKAAVTGEVCDISHKFIEKSKAWVISFDVTDYTGTIHVSKFMSSASKFKQYDSDSATEDDASKITKRITAGMWLTVSGRLSISRFDGDLVLEPDSIVTEKHEPRLDNAKTKRVELHLHTKMSALDAVTDTAEAVRCAAQWGHPAIAITDHGVVHSFPDAADAAYAEENKIKVIYGLEGYFYNDLEHTTAVFGGSGAFDGEFVVFDIETTGLIAAEDRILEIGAVLVKNGAEADRFHIFVDPKMPIPPHIKELTGLKDEDVAGAPQQKDAIIAFLEFARGKTLVAQNADFDVGFICEACDKNGIVFADYADEVPGSAAVTDSKNTADVYSGSVAGADTKNTADAFSGIAAGAGSDRNAQMSYNTAMPAYVPRYIDTLVMARILLPKLKNHRLDTVAAYFGYENFNHHRAVDDASTTAGVFFGLLKMLQEAGITKMEDVNDYLAAQFEAAERKRRVKYRHIILLAKNQTGIKNLYKLVTISHLDDFNNYPCIRKSVLMKHREGLILGSACENGEVFDAVVTKRSSLELSRYAEFYDYLEIQPICNNRFMIFSEKPKAADDEELRSFNRKVVQLGKQLGKPVVATGDVHFLEPEHEIFRQILLAPKELSSVNEELPLYLKTTDEMLEEFSYLGEETAYEVVVENSRMIAGLCETVSPLPPKKTLFSPKLENSAIELRELVAGKLVELYGDTPPPLVKNRVDTELRDILERNYDVIYMTAQKLVADAKRNGNIVGSRGSVGSSIVAYLAGVTDVNSLPAHYRCPQCRTSDFESGAHHGCGADMPDAFCPECGKKYIKDGFNIPFETFLGFGGDKVPDIDLNFSSEYQATAHRYTADLFGADRVYKAGTINKLAKETAYGYVKKYLEIVGRTVTKAEENRLVRGCSGVKKTTGQHPGGLVVIPQGMEITDFCPAQHPSNKEEKNIVTTHFDYHCMEDNLIKIDALGHDNPTMLKMLEEMTGVAVDDIPLDDPGTMALFVSPGAIGLPENDSIIGETGSIGIPEFGTNLTRQMLCDTKPDKIDTLVRLSGFAHGEAVWMGNARDLILSGKASVGETIGCRDDIMLFLISKGMDDRYAFKVSESVRKGNGLPDGAEKELSNHGVPGWYIDSCKKIQYLFPKAHAVAYVMMAFRIAWFKVHKPLEFYGAHFYRRRKYFDAEYMTRGINIVRAKLQELKGNSETKGKDEELLITLEACYEFYMRGFSFAEMDIYESAPEKFLIVDEKRLRPPLIAISGLGDTVVYDISENREGREFVSIDELSAACKKLSKTHVEQLKALGALRGMPESSQMSLF